MNLVTESLPAMSITADPPEPNYMEQPPFNSEGWFSPQERATILQKGTLFGLNTFSLFASGLKWGGWSLDKARTMAFGQLVINRMFNLVNERKAESMKTANTGGNPFVLPAAAITVAMFAGTIYLPFMRTLFTTVPIGFRDWMILIVNAFATGQVDIALEAKSKNVLGSGAIPLPLPTPESLPSN